MIVTVSFSSCKRRSFGFLVLVVTLLLALVFTGCKQKETVVRNIGEASASNAEVKKGIKPQPDDQVAVIETADYGNIVIELYPNIAPQMVERFKKLIQEGFYNGTAFHRINPGLIQGGDPLSKDDDPGNDGTGDSPYPNVPAEFSDIPYELGVVGAARKQAPNSANCQFFITLRRVSQFDERYTVFGRVIEGITNTESIMRAPVAGGERPAKKIVVKSVTLQPRSKYAPSQP